MLRILLINGNKFNQLLKIPSNFISNGSQTTFIPITLENKQQNTQIIYGSNTKNRQNYISIFGEKLNSSLQSNSSDENIYIWTQKIIKLPKPSLNYKYKLLLSIIDLKLLSQKIIDQKPFEKIYYYWLLRANQNLFDDCALSTYLIYLSLSKNKTQAIQYSVQRFKQHEKIIYSSLLQMMMQTNQIYSLSKALYISQILKLHYTDEYSQILKKIDTLLTNYQLSQQDLDEYLYFLRVCDAFFNKNSEENYEKDLKSKILKIIFNQLFSNNLVLTSLQYKYLLRVSFLELELNPYHVNFQNFLEMVSKDCKSLNVDAIAAILRYLSSVGSADNLEQVSILNQSLIQNISSLEKIDDYQLITILKSAIYFNLKDLIKEIVQLEKFQKILELAKHFQSLDTITNSLERAFYIYQTLYLLPYYYDIKIHIDHDWIEKYLFSYHELFRALPKSETDILYYLDLLGIEYVREVIVGPYVIDIFIPNLINREEANRRALNILSSGNITFKPNDCQIAFYNPCQMKDYFNIYKSLNSKFIEIDGYSHFYDSSRQRFMNGKSLLKRNFFEKNLQIKLTVFKNKELQQIFMDLENKQKIFESLFDKLYE